MFTKLFPEELTLLIIKLLEKCMKIKSRIFFPHKDHYLMQFFVIKNLCFLRLELESVAGTKRTLAGASPPPHSA